MNAVLDAAHRLIAQTEASQRDLRAKELSYFLVSGDALTDEIRRALDTGDELELGRIVRKHLGGLNG